MAVRGQKAATPPIGSKIAQALALVVPTALISCWITSMYMGGVRGQVAKTPVRHDVFEGVGRVLERHATLVSNLTIRLQTAESALVMVRDNMTQRLVRQSQKLSSQVDTLRKMEQMQKVQSKRVPAAARPAPQSVVVVADSEESAKDDTDDGVDDIEDGESGAEDSQDDGGSENMLTSEEEEKEHRVQIEFNPSTGKFKHSRGDYKCGDRVPLLPDGNLTGCDPTSDMPCCSAEGWCGKSRAHCRCGGCTDFRKLHRIAIRDVRLVQEKRECQTIAENLNEFLRPEDCARKAVKTETCGKHIMWSDKYKEWGCRCCAVGEDVDWENMPLAEHWDLYRIELAKIGS
eukprot:TRINITY_DN101850_c0_g1_i1.p1 TRINITY_DN101850_c0_g1~~TRINITY_DN101850_c0_g1_i1.p1  ORF type:complete len:345 (-),score=76.36 TRINITY_DN101850_c0_g1_i1:48-1082(-)